MKRVTPGSSRISRPAEFSGFAMFYGHNIVFLPGYGDDTFYARLAALPKMTAECAGDVIPWPDSGPMYLFDQAAAERRERTAQGK